MRISEQAVFRWVVIVALAAASIAMVTLLFEPLVGAIWALMLICAGVWHGYRRLDRRR